MDEFKTFKKGFVGGLDTLLITSDFGKRKNNRGEIESHNGIDIGISQGTALYAPLSGKIIERKVQKNGAGLYICLRSWCNDSSFIDIYFMHLHSTEADIQIGKNVLEGKKIGTTGGDTKDPNCGRSTGPHLHLEIRDYGAKHLDPKRWFLARHTLKSSKTGKFLHWGDDTWLTFGRKHVVSQTNKEYSIKADITVQNATEYVVKKKKESNTEAKEKLAPGIWQIVKLVIDSSVENKQVLDSGISTLQGSLLNFFRKVCQEPLVEFSGDTFGNQYYWYVRKPPFDKESMLKMIELTTIQINPKNIISSDLTWNNQGIYSWYQYIPYADLLGINEIQQIVPAVFFPEYASIWGSKPLAVESNYFHFVYSGIYNSKNKKEDKENANRVLKNAIIDFKYLIESNAYNPFTRRGTITILGDRRIKRGTLIMYTTGEIFHVDSVINNYDIGFGNVNRTTTLNVSKGMYPDFIYGVEDDGKIYSYFNIIDFGKDFDINKINSDNWEKIISKWKVNLDSFGFFLTKQQVAYSNAPIVNVENK